MNKRIGIILTITVLVMLTAAGCGQITTKTVVDTTTQNTIQTEPTTLYNTIGINSASTKAANGLSLSVSTDQTDYAPGQEVQIVTDENNTLAKTNNIPIADNWTVSGLIRMGFGNPDPNIPYGIAVYQGDYTLANVSAAMPLNP
jgi:predicted secreted protein